MHSNEEDNHVNSCENNNVGSFYGQQAETDTEINLLNENPKPIYRSRGERRKAAKLKRLKQSSSSSSCCLKLFCCCCHECASKSRCFLFLVACRKTLKTFVQSWVFQRAILCAILVNTLSMGIEHHEQVDLFNIKYTYLVFYEELILFCNHLAAIFDHHSRVQQYSIHHCISHRNAFKSAGTWHFRLHS